MINWLSILSRARIPFQGSHSLFSAAISIRMKEIHQITVHKTDRPTHTHMMDGVGEDVNTMYSINASKIYQK